MFAKIFNSIFDSSIADDWKTRIVFQDLLVLADKDGIVDATPSAISRRTNLPLEIVTEAIPKLEAPDHTSRTPDHEGRRLLRLDAHRAWGWRIVNFTKYRESATKEMLRMAEADRKRAYRAKFNRSPSPTPPTLKNQKQRQKENSPGTSPGLSRTSPTLSTTDRISHERELTEINRLLRELGRLVDHDKGSKKYNRIMELTEKQTTLKNLLGVVA